MTLLHALEIQYDAPLVNARAWLDDDAFSDGHHTFVTGADAFTERLTRDVIDSALKAGR